MMLVPLMLAALLQTADPSPVPPPQETPETQEIIVVARPHKCSVAIANHVLSDPEFKARMTEWAAGVPVRVVVPNIRDMRCLTQIMFKLADHGVTHAMFVER